MNTADRLADLSVSITRWVDDEPQPGIVEFTFSDCVGKTWTFIDKQAIVSSEQLGSNSRYPKSSSIRCYVISEIVDKTGREIVEIDTQKPWGVESIEGSHIFSVFADQLSHSGAGHEL